MPELLLYVLILVGIYACTGGARFGQLSVISLFIYAQATMAAGTLPALDATNVADQTHALLISLTLTVLVLVGFVGSFSQKKISRKTYAPEVDYAVPGGKVAFFILLSVAITAGYYLSIGYIAFFESLQALAGDTGEDLAGLRLESYAGSRYFFPGYVNQFKNALLPAMTIVALISMFHFRKKGRALVAVLLIPTVLVALLGTGQRGAFVLAIGVTLITAYFLAPRSFRKYALRIALLGLLLFFITTIASGRAAADLRDASGFGAQVGVLFEQLAFRLFGSNQTSSVIGFRYIFELSVPFGSEWAQAFVGLLPGQSGSDLSSRIFAVLYGSTRGTAPVSLWGSAYHNFGLPGAMILAGVIGIIFCSIAAKINATTHTNLIQIAGMAGVTITLGTWIADGPVAPLNAGIAIYILLWWWGARIARRRALAGEIAPSMPLRKF